MKKKSPSRSAFFNPRFLISFALCTVGVSIALFAFAANPITTALPNQDQPLAYDSIVAPDAQVPDEPASEPVISNAPAGENTEAAGGQVDGGGCSQINGTNNPQGLSESGVAAPAGFFWSEVQHDTGNLTESNTSAGFAALQGTFRLADNFTLSQPCLVQSVVIYAYQTGAPASPSPFTAFTLQIHNGRPGDPGVMVVFGDTSTNRLASSVDSTFFRLFNTAVPPPGTPPGTTRKIWKNTLTVGVTLPAGTYWVDWASTVSNGGAHFHPTTTIPGARSAASDNARQLTVATSIWADVIDTGNPATAPDVLQDFPFEVVGIPAGGTPSPTPTATATGTATATSTPTATATASPSCGGTVLSENFDSVTAPALPAGWVASNAAGAAPLWVTTTTTPDTAPNDAFVDDPAVVTDKLLDTPAISITSAAAQVTFRNFYFLESTFDGGVLEVSSPNINGGAFTDVTNAAVGGSFTAGGYNATISTAFMSPIAGRMAWSGNAGGYINSAANLGPNVAGQTIKLRFRMASDNSVTATGWRVDTVAVTGGACPSGTPTATSTATTGGSPGGTPACPPIITHSSSQAITTGNSVSCNNGTGHTDNSYWRAFNMGTFVGGAAYNVTSVSFGVESANVTQPVTVRLYTNSGAPFPAGTRTQIATTTVSVTAAQTGTVVSAPLSVTVPAGTSELVMELFTPDGQAAGNLFFVGSNASPETGPSYISAAACGITVPTTTAAVGFPNMHVVFNVHGTCGGTPAPTPTATATTGGSPTPTATCAIGWAPGPAVPAVGAVRAPGNFFPANGRFYIIGGRNADVAGADFTNPFEYNPATNTWVTKPSLIPDGQVNNMACGVLTAGGTDQIYCVGGSMSQVVGTASRVFSYNPATDTFTTLTAADNWPGSQGGTFLPGGFAVNGNKLYIIGSFNANAVPPVVTGQVWQFDPTAAVGSRWLQRADFPVMRGYVPAASIGTSIYTGGGSNLDPGGTLIDTVESFKYDTATNTWTAIANIPRATAETRAVVVNNEMWVLGGGRVAPNPSNQVDIYNPGSNTWTTGTPFVTARRNFPADSDGTFVFLAGGYDSSGTTLLNTMEIFGTVVCPSPSPTPTATSTATATSTGSPPPTATATATVASSPSPTPTPTPSASVSPSASPSTQPLNLSTRMRILTDANVGIGGFIVTGTVPKTVLLRGIGPSLANFGVPDPLADPVMELHGPKGFSTVTNDNWMDTQAAAIEATGLAPTNNLESAILATLEPGNYTAIVKGKDNGVGVGLVEAYDLDPPTGEVANISTRAFVGTGSDIMIAGFILGGNGGDTNVILRGIGPSLTQFGVPDALADPTLELRDNSGTLLISNDNWQDDPGQAAIITKAGLAPTDPAESAIASTLSPGTYTALLAGKNNGTGVGLVEAYDVGAGAVVPTPTPGVSPSPGASPTASVGASPTATATATAGGNPCTENWDSVTAPALPAGWTATNPDPGDGTMWETSITNPDSAPNCAFIGDQDGISDKVLDWMTVTINSASAVLSFRNNFNTEFSDGIFWDGYVLEVSSPNISGGAFLDITDSHVGGSFVSGGYTGEIDGTANNPLAGRMAWSADSGGYIDTAINLGPNLAGQTVTLRFRMGTDEAVAAPGVRMDGLSISNSSCP